MPGNGAQGGEAQTFVSYRRGIGSGDGS